MAEQKLYPKKSRKPLEAIRFFCFECMGWDRRCEDSGKPFDDVRQCTDEMCPLFDFRFGRNPFHKCARKPLYAVRKPPQSTIAASGIGSGRTMRGGSIMAENLPSKEQIATMDNEALDEAVARHVFGYSESALANSDVVVRECSSDRADAMALIYKMWTWPDESRRRAAKYIDELYALSKFKGDTIELVMWLTGDIICRAALLALVDQAEGTISKTGTGPEPGGEKKPDPACAAEASR